MAAYTSCLKVPPVQLVADWHTFAALEMKVGQSVKHSKVAEYLIFLKVLHTD